MAKTDTRLNVPEILNILADSLKKARGCELSFHGEQKTNSNLRLFVQTEKGNFQIAFLCIRRHRFSWWIKKNGRRLHHKYSFPTNMISVLVSYIEVALQHFNSNIKPCKKTAEGLNGISLHLTSDVLGKIKRHIFIEPTLECGGYLIGRLQWSDDEQNVIGYVEDVFHDDSVGSSAHFVFKSQYGLKAYSYCLKKYANKDGAFSKNIIGNYHSHGNIGAFFSGQDRVMIFLGTAPEFYLVFSPGKKEVTALFKNKQQQLFATGLTNDMDFRYCEPTIPQNEIDFSRKGKA